MMNPSTQYQFHRRAFAVGTVLLTILAAVLLRLAYLQLGAPPPVMAGSSSAQRENFRPERGNIYDCHGYLLAVSTTVYDIGAIPQNIEDKLLVADRLSSVLGEPRDKLLALLQQGGAYVRLKRGVTAAVQESIMEWGTGMLQAEPRAGRIYPHGTLAACVLGFVTDDGKAHYGLEGYYDEILRGQWGYRLEDRDSLGSLLYHIRPSRNGADLVLTLDRNVQYIVEEALANGVTASGAKKGIIIVMDPTSGAILAIASYPSYDPNARRETDTELYTNPAVSDQYEPGSVFKIVTIASALDVGIISPSSTYFDNGQIVVGGRVIQNSDRRAHGQTNIYDLLAFSLNVGAAHVSTSLGPTRFYQYVRSFGFGEQTGIDLADEISGWLRLPGDREWHESDLGTNSFGQGIAVTPLQMLCAVSAVANHGVLMRPYIVSRIVDGNKVTETSPQVVRRVISAEAAAQTTEMLVYTVDKVATAAAVPGYRVAGKTGTSEIPIPGGYDPQETIASFAGYVPADNPRFAILVVLDRPQKEHWGEKAAAPVFQKIAQQLVTLLGVPSDSAR